jgi:hypothetical protein
LKWRDGDHESAFYLTYGLLAAHIARGNPEPLELWMDERSDRYDKRAEVLQIVTNYRSKRHVGAGELTRVRMVDSKKSAITQMADAVIGAVTADTHRFLSRETVLREGKQEVVERIAAMIGWDGLHYDTYPNAEFNVWHFPPQFRARPATRAVTLISKQLA